MCIAQMKIEKIVVQNKELVLFILIIFSSFFFYTFGINNISKLELLFYFSFDFFFGV